MTGRRVPASAGGLLGAAAVLALGAAVALGPGAPARAAPTPVFALQFTGLSPGVPMTEQGEFTLEREATLASFAWLEREGVMELVDLAVEVCDAAGTCVDPVAETGVPFSAGEVSVSVTAVLAGEAGNGEAGSIVGRLDFTADDVPGGGGGLASTGSLIAAWAATAAALLAVGALVVTLARGRRDGPSRGAP
ncbi:hypothetical protein ACGGZK_16045 [Agromyces sp. MMS24-K17]|uniref:hypothetical protein n=1 Tax=Agromyces sp. MMS24-K17 TaxID=3372850 RepID=UPI0037552B6F